MEARIRALIEARRALVKPSVETSKPPKHIQLKSPTTDTQPFGQPTLGKGDADVKRKLPAAFDSNKKGGRPKLPEPERQFRKEERKKMKAGKRKALPKHFYSYCFDHKT
jgi:hypothetical protein